MSSPISDAVQAFTPVAILLISWISRIAEPNKKLAVIVFMISIGVALTSHGELRFNLVGFLTQSAAVGVRLLSSYLPKPLNINVISTVRSFSPRNDSDSPPRSEDGPSGVPPLLCTRLRCHQSYLPPFHRRSRSFLRTSADRAFYSVVECTRCFFLECGSGIPGGRRQWIGFDTSWRVQGMTLSCKSGCMN